MKDPILEVLIDLAESETEKPIEQDITLIVGGFLVSGYIISSKKYMDHHETTKRIYLAKEKIIAEDSAETPEPPDETYNFIHLRNAKYYLPGAKPIPGNISIYVRISLESVNGFSFGTLDYLRF
jgi:hypothetical protein